MSDNFILCESCEIQHDDSCGWRDINGFWHCETCWKKNRPDVVAAMTSDEEDCRGYSRPVFKSWQ